MSVIGSNILAGTAAQAGDFELDQSLRFEDGDSPELVRSVTVAGNRRTSTWSAWVKIGWNTFSNDSSTIEPTHTLFCCGNSDGRWNVGFSNATATNNNLPQLFIGQRDSGGSQAFEVSSNQAFRDPSSWYHIVVVMDTTQSTNTDRVKAYINGERITDWGVTSFPSQNYDSDVFRTADPVVKVRLGSTVTNSNTGANFWDGYMAEVHVVDGTALDASYFGETKATTGQWIPKKVSGVTYGTNGFYLPFSATELANSFTDSSDPTTFTVNSTISSADILIVAGGGGGGSTLNGRSAAGGSGGAGGLLEGTGISLNAGSYTVLVGAGGAGGIGESNPGGFTHGKNGGDSKISNTTWGTATALGGGYATVPDVASPASGGSGGGGGGHWDGDDGSTAGATGTQANSNGLTGYGNNGGDGGQYAGGAGGGAGGAGSNNGGSAGAGRANAFRTGSNVTYATGGAGRGQSAGDGADGSANTGDGGQGGYHAGGGAHDGGDGGSGIIVIRYISGSPLISGGTVTSYTSGSDTYQVHTWLTGDTRVQHTITANGDVANSRAQAKIGSSSIKFDGTGDYLSVADSDDWSFGTGDFTLEAYVRFNDSAGTENLFSQYQGSSNRWYLSADLTNNSLGFYDAGSGMDVEKTVVTWVADTWYHVAMVRNSGTVTYYVNGTAYTITGTNPNGNITSNTGTLQIGRYNTGDDLNGYMDEIRISNSARYTGAFTPTTTAFTADSYTKLLIHSDFNGGLGADNSGNKNDLDPTNLVVTDQVLDSPTLNYCTLNPVDGFNSMTATEGNLRANTNSGSDPKINATFQIPQSGKWYWEFVDQHGLSIMVGVIDQTNSGNIYGNNNSAIYSSGLGTKYNFSSVSSYGASWTTGDIIGVAINRDDNEITFYKNNSSQGTFTIGGTAAQRARLIPVMGTGTTGTGGGTFNFGQDSSFHGTKTAQGNGDDGEDFYYTPPTGYKALNSSNLDDPAIALPTAHFNTVLYTGDGTTNNSITGVGFQPDFVWYKVRSTTGHHNLYDSVRGVQKVVYSDLANAEATSTGTQDLYAFGADGFTVGSDFQTLCNTNGSTFASWNWKAGGAASSNSDGTTTSSVSANTTAGFSIVSYAGSGSAGATVGHGLSQTPDLIIIKNRTAVTNWVVNSPITNSGFTEWALKLDLDQATSTDSTIWNNTAPTSSVFTLGTAGESNRNNPDNYIAYCFHSVDGYSKVGSYTGNGATDGPFVYTGFRPAFIMVKLVTAASGSWVMFDNKRDPDNPTDRVFYADINAISTDVSSYSPYDLLSNGFKSRIPAGNGNEASYNSSGQTYLYLAFAESPFKTANAR